MYGRTVAPVEPLLVNFAGYLILLLGLSIGWVRGFPRWSFGYASLVLILTLEWAGKRGLDLWPLRVKYDGSTIGWSAWLPFLATVVVVLLLTRSLRPLRQLVVGIWNDWTRLSLALFGLVTWMSLWYEGMHHPYLNVFILATTLVLSVGAGAYARIKGSWQRVAMLLLTLPAVALVNAPFEVTGGYSSVPSLPAPQAWYMPLLQIALALTFYVMLMYAPGVVGLARRMMKPTRRIR
jgi:hypothetical protein